MRMLNGVVFFFSHWTTEAPDIINVNNKDPLPNDMQGTYHVLQGRRYVFL